MNVYAYYNKLVGAFVTPYFDELPKEAQIKQFERLAVLKPELCIEKGLDVVDLYYLGEFDDVKGEFKLEDKPEFLASIESQITRYKQEKLNHGTTEK